MTQAEKMIYRRRDRYTILFVPYSVSETGVKVQHRKGNRLEEKGINTDLIEAIIKRQRINFPRD